MKSKSFGLILLLLGIFTLFTSLAPAEVDISEKVRILPHSL